MGLLLKRQIADDCLLGVWEITEDYDTLFSQVVLSDFDLQRLNSFQNESRKLESLSVRALLQTLTHRGARIIYNQFRKPFMDDYSYNISISHSCRWTSIMLSQQRRVGIDLEYMSHDMERLAHKFINDKEYITPDLALRQQHIYIHWCAKEALYKICDKDGINFQDNLTIYPFEPQAGGQITGLVTNNHLHEEFILQYEIRDNYVVAYTYK
jgi:phosphopantetheinyl transferase